MTQKKKILRKDIAEEFSLHSRDLRPVFGVRQLSTISPRGEVIVLNLRDIKLLIGEKKAVLFGNITEEIEKDFLPSFFRKFNAEETPFSLALLDFSLSFVFQKLQRRFSDHEHSVQKTFFGLKRAITDQYFEMLLTLKNHISKFEILVKEIEEAIEEILKDEDDLRRISQKASLEEIESVLEHSWEQYEDLTHRIHALNENIDDTQEIITLKMANRRNIIIRFDLVATLITAVLSGFAVITGIFGMNLLNHFEANSFAFLTVVLGIVFFFLLFLALGVYHLKKKKIW